MQNNFLESITVNDNLARRPGEDASLPYLVVFYTGKNLVEIWRSSNLSDASIVLCVNALLNNKTLKRESHVEFSYLCVVCNLDGSVASVGGGIGFSQPEGAQSSNPTKILDTLEKLIRRSGKYTVEYKLNDEVNNESKSNP